jgi:hypothetical protein
MFFQMPASDIGELIETSTLASFDVNYSRSKTDEIRVLVEYDSNSLAHNEASRMFIYKQVKL